MPNRLQLWLEMIGLYILFPLLLFFRIFPFSLMLVLTGMGLLVAYLLWRDPTFNNRQLWVWPKWRREMAPILVGFLPIALLMSVVTWYWMPENFFRLPKERPWLLLLIAVFYPLFSVIPQAILYRALFFHRYAFLISGFWSQVFVNATLFMFGHILFRNELALLLTFCGGFLFAYRYLKTESLSATIFEHALYGVWLFACGMGIVLVLRG